MLGAWQGVWATFYVLWKTMAEIYMAKRPFLQELRLEWMELGRWDGKEGDKSGRGCLASGFCLPLSPQLCSFPCGLQFFSHFYLPLHVTRWVFAPFIFSARNALHPDHWQTGWFLFFGSQRIVTFSERPFSLLAGCITKTFFESMQIDSKFAMRYLAHYKKGAWWKE